jgi:site-specific DNA-methyltransferase (cytosine-N4-specific)
MSKHTTGSLFEHIEAAYSNTDKLTNNQLYDIVKFSANIPDDEMNKLEPIGKEGKPYSKIKRQIRWYQQELKHLGLLERVENKRGVWQLTNEGKAKLQLHKINNSFQMLAFSTKLGIGIWGDARKVFEKSTEPIHLILSSPPYPLNEPRAYGNSNESEYVDWICYILEPIISNLVDGGNIVLNISNDISLLGSPAKSLYKERLVIALSDRFGLYKMDEIPWVNLSKVPSNAWATKKKKLLLPGWEPILWFCNNPKKTLSDSNRILTEYSKSHISNVKRGPLKKDYLNGDGAYKLKRGKYYSINEKGTIPKNVFIRGHASKSTKDYFEKCKELNIPRHGAVFPYELPEFIIKFLTKVNNLVVDPFFGKGTTGLAADNLNRRWIGTDLIWEYLRGGGEMFQQVEFNNNFLEV